MTEGPGRAPRSSAIERPQGTNNRNVRVLGKAKAQPISAASARCAEADQDALEFRAAESEAEAERVSAIATRACARHALPCFVLPPWLVDHQSDLPQRLHFWGAALTLSAPRSPRKRGMRDE